MPRSTRLPFARVVLGVAAAWLALTACGTSDPEPSGSEAATENASAEGCDGVETSSGPVTVTDAFDRTVELDEPAERVAVLEWQQTEMVLSLCLNPVAVADVEGFGQWNTAEELPEGVEDVGTRGEPNLDALFAAQPDLVIVEASGEDDPVLTQLDEYDVPVLATVGADTTDPIQNMRDTFTLIAEATGREDRAEQVLEEFETTLEEAKQAVADSDVTITDFVYFDGYAQGGNVAFRPFGQGSLFGELGEELGLTNAWTGPVDEAYGLGSTDIEGMRSVGDAAFFYTGTEIEEYQLAPLLEGNPAWSSIPAVAEGRLYEFPPGIWTFGGPRSAEQALQAYVDLLTN
ncbi:iron-siderophore ABC transporter substrate-binding protein [Blastococcus sp. CCUG 61487]|uniref:ABC transporter substrate-binding protein n=1 Tax=Blastococcus sp. CCUG 61487 TaxID=1840703 RepID=UPI0010C08642|nr:iron-siderophore ABC transporter substrate-binding protein [Blastococcus sp. CCUG 61487]TKJ20670.1 Fe3+-hydroxamate ABC transporter [Blastococcus sp. CCUG 61487]